MAAFRPLEMIAFQVAEGRDVEACDPAVAVMLNLDAVLFITPTRDGKATQVVLSNGSTMTVRGTPAGIKLPTG